VEVDDLGLFRTILQNIPGASEENHEKLRITDP
jgi:hypothetical protein